MEDERRGDIKEELRGKDMKEGQGRSREKRKGG